MNDPEDTKGTDYKTKAEAIEAFEKMFKK